MANSAAVASDDAAAAADIAGLDLIEATGSKRVSAWASGEETEHSKKTRNSCVLVVRATITSL